MPLGGRRGGIVRLDEEGGVGCWLVVVGLGGGVVGVTRSSFFYKDWRWLRWCSSRALVGRRRSTFLFPLVLLRGVS